MIIFIRFTGDDWGARTLTEFEMHRYFYLLDSNFFYLRYGNSSVFIKGKNICIN